jgi:PIN domain
VLRLLVDTSVWLDLAKRRDGQRWIVPLRVLKFQRKLELLVPSVVVDEFERNRPRAEAAATTGVLDRFRQLRQDLHEYGGDERMQWLEEMSRQVPMVSSGVLQNFSEISELLHTGIRLEPSREDIEGAMNRGLEKRAPFHLNKNSTGDALIIELYGAALRDDDHRGDAHCFVTSNYLDFSIPNGDRREPHPDLSAFFTDQRSEYFYGVEGLDTALVNNLGNEFTVEAKETTLVQEEPRTLAEILQAEKEFFDKIWYVRKLILREKIEAGEEEPLPIGMDERIDEPMRAIEERYGADNVGPWDDWGWGFVHGKLSALRWVLGSEWDFLDT